MLKLYLLGCCIAFLLRDGLGCEDQGSEQEELAGREDAESFLLNAYGFSNDHGWQNSRDFYQAQFPYQGRAPIRNSNPFLKYIVKGGHQADREAEPEGRLFSNLGGQILNAALFNNRFTNTGNTYRPLAGLANRLPISLNPNYANQLTTFDSCKSPNGEDGVCAPGSICSVFGGRPSGSCLLGVCCVNVVSTCGGTVTLNNTYWQSPITAVSSPSTCALTVRLNSQLLEQKKPICQIRLDFLSFSIAQPDNSGAAGTSICSVDTFQVGGALSRSPVICGDNAGQHMYLQVPNSGLKTTDVQLLFSFGTAASTQTRTWNIKIALLPCGADYLAPSDCLQYFTSAAGTVSSFNWKDVAPGATAVRQLANQDYNICFRPEIVANQQSSRICYSVCSGLTNPRSGFAVSGDATVAAAAQTVGVQNQAPVNFCPNDFLTIVGGFDQTVTTTSLDRYCGTAFSASSESTVNTVVCSTARPFRIYYKTNADEVTGGADTGNTGFCLTWSES